MYVNWLQLGLRQIAESPSEVHTCIWENKNTNLIQKEQSLSSKNIFYFHSLRFAYDWKGLSISITTYSLMPLPCLKDLLG